MKPPRARWFDAGNTATGFFVIGNVVTGVIAIGNVARGFIAIGNVAVGVIAIGNVGFGILGGGGATVALGLFAASGVIALPVLEGAAGITNLEATSPLFSLIPIALWAVASRVFPGQRAPRPGPALCNPAALERGEIHEGWIRARAELAAEGRIRLVLGRGALELQAAPEALSALAGLRAMAAQSGEQTRVVALLRAEERIRQHEGGYREAGERQRVLVCAGVEAAPEPVVPWTDSGELQWWLARAWRVGALVGFVGLMAKVALFFL